MTNSVSWFEYYRYNPSLAAAVIFIVLFILTTILHCYQLLRTRTWYFIPFLIGGCLEWIGYIGRALSSQESPNWMLAPYVIQTLCLLIAPALFAASIYMELGRIILLVEGEQHSLIKKRWLTKIFVTGDVFAFGLQAAGGGIMSGGSLSTYHNGEHIVVAGLVVQAFSFGCFLTVAILFDLAMHRAPTAKARMTHILWYKHLKTLYLASGLIMFRSVFRVVEYIMGNDGYLLRHEYYLYIFDAVLMFAVMVVFNIVHPSEVRALLKGGWMVKGLKMVKLEEDSHSQVDKVISNGV